MAPVRLGELLLKANVISEAQLRAALGEQKKWGGRLGEVLVRMHMLTEDLLVRALAKQLGIAAVNMDTIPSIPSSLRDRLPSRLAIELRAVPIALKDENRTFVVAMSEPQNLNSIDKIRAVVGCRVAPNVATLSGIERAIERFYNVTLPKATSYVPQFAPGMAPEENTGSFKILDAQGRPKFEVERQEKARSTPEFEIPPARPAATSSTVSKRPTRSPFAAPPGVGPTESLAAEPLSAPVPVSLAAPPPSTGTPSSAAQQLQRFEELQRREVATVKAIVDLLIEKGYFTREEYLAKMRR